MVRVYTSLARDNSQGQLCIIDPSALLRPESKFSYKPVSEYRDYSVDENDEMKERVRRTYTLMHTHQNVDFVKQKMDEWCRFDKFEATIMDTLEKLNGLVDESDPDVDIPNIIHAFQTAEHIRRDYPDQKWFQLTGLIHDLGKVMAMYGEAQWAVVGDTFPVGCAWADSIVYRDTTFHENSDTHHPLYKTTYGMYQPNTGLKNVLMSWGHDEYLYRVLKNHPSCTLPEEGLYIIRFHSFYPWHTGEDYDYLCSTEDLKMKEWVKLFNNYDLYTKGGELPKMEYLKQYYQALIDEFIPGVLKW